MRGDAPIKADVFLRGVRDYVQGTQLIARSSEVLGEGRWLLEQATFSRITRKLVEIGDCQEDRDTLGSVSFRNTDGDTQRLCLFEGTQGAPRRDIPLGVEVTRTGEGAPNEVVYRFEGVNVFEDLVNALVAAIKAEHEVRVEGGADIWLTGLRDFAIPIGGPYPFRGEIELLLIRELRRDAGSQTLWRAAVKGVEGSPFANGAVTFTHKTGLNSDAD